MKPPIPENENDRNAELRTFHILDSLPEQDYDDITKLASKICETPISLITLIDKDRQWVKSKYGADVNETPRQDAFCSYTILEPNQPLIVSNMREDARFKDNPFVKGEPNIDFYAGVPLVTDNGYPLGSLCVMDVKPHSLSSEKVEALKILGRQVMNLLKLHKKVKELSISKMRMERTVDNLREFSKIVAHDIKAPVRNMRMFAQIILEDFGDDLNDEIKEHVNHIIKSAYKSHQYIDGVLSYSKTVHFLKHDVGRVDLNQLMEDIAFQLTPPEGIKINFPKNLPVINASKTALQIVLSNLIGNAVKYNDKEEGKIDIDLEVKDDFATFTVKDNGRGIPQSELEKIFSLFYTVTPDKEADYSSTGVGLSIVQKIVTDLGGHISVESKENEGSTFTFTITL
ncbi:GAF domain-containing sensor histidine kinase [Portibacter marinus]|uniref:GAF domain-containing sensor histidine kinase n=1 Tax=Portibacter marinus TaxID=2898660 RepID=UPI001F1A6C29|nr:GAF domain-containing sensor histidine kinase [Portibacter marinus]